MPGEGAERRAVKQNDSPAVYAVEVCVSACDNPTYSELYHRGQESTRSADAQQVVDC